MTSSHRVGVLDLVRASADNDEQSRDSVGKIFWRLGCATLIIDLGCAVALLGDFQAWAPKDMLHSFTWHNVVTGFRSQPVDVVALTLSRLIAGPVLIYLSVSWAQAAMAGQSRREGLPATQSPLPATSKDLGDGYSALLGDDKAEAEGERGSVNVGAAANAEVMDVARQNAKARSRRYKYGGLTLLFIFSTFYQVYIGLKISTFDFREGHKSIEAVLICLGVLWINIEVYVARQLILEATRDEGLFLPDVHPHPLFMDKGVALHWCDLCSTKIKNHMAWRCKLCDFDMCTVCAARKDAATVGENLLRNDKGVKQEKDMSNGSYFKRSLSLVKEELPLFMGAFLLLFLYTATNLALPNYQGLIIDKVSNDNREGFLVDVRSYVILMAVQGVFSACYSAAFSVVSRKILFFIRVKLFGSILAQDVAFFDGTTSGHLTSRLTNDISVMMEPIRSSLSTLLYNLITLVGGIVMCYYTSYQLSMLAFVTVGPITYLWDLYGTWSKRLTRRMLSAWGEGNSIATEALGHVRTVKSFATEPLETSLYIEANKEALRLGIKDSLGFGATSALTGYLDLGAGVLILWYGGSLVLRDDGSLSVGKLVTFQLYWNMMNGAYQALQGLFTSFTRSAAAAEKVFSLLDSCPDINSDEGDPIDWPVSGAFSLRAVDFRYQMRPDNPVLQGLNLEIPGGSVCALVGRSGGGKSTIVNMLMRFYDPAGGSISLDGRDLRSLKVAHHRGLCGVVAQDTPLFARTILENITYGHEEHEYTMEQVVSAAKQAYAHDFILDMKDGYSTRVGERGGRISGGQRQRIAIARIFLRRPKIILLDEATSALDEDSQAAVQTALDKLIATGGATVVLVAHRLSTVMNADKIAVIDKGQVMEEGSHDELLAKNGVYATLVRKQLAKKASVLDQGKEKDAEADTIDKLLDAMQGDESKLE